MQISGVTFLIGYIVLLGVGTFLQKFSMKQLNPYQLHFLISIGMLITSIPALIITQRNLFIPLKGIPIGGAVGILFASGSLLFTLALSKMSAGTATAISLSYVLVVLLLSTIFLKEGLSAVKVLGIVLTVLGVAILSLKTS